MNSRVINVLVGLVAISAIAIFAIYGTSALTNAAGRYPRTNSLQVAGQFEAARALSIALMVLLTGVLRQWKALGALLLTVGLIEFCDTAIGISQGQIGQIISPLLSGILYLIVGWFLFRRDTAQQA
jgi:uncharacterized membrane protein YgdD (TMEM256/DUF423 family)